MSGLRDLSRELYMPRSANAMRRGTLAPPWVENAGVGECVGGGGVVRLGGGGWWYSDCGGLFRRWRLVVVVGWSICEVEVGGTVIVVVHLGSGGWWYRDYGGSLERWRLVVVEVTADGTVLVHLGGYVCGAGRGR